MKFRYIQPLTCEEIASLEAGYQNGEKHYFRLKCKSILLSHEGKTITEIAAFAQKAPRTIRNWFNEYESEGIKKLTIEKGRGVKSSLDAFTESEIEVIKQELQQNYQSIKVVCANLSQTFGFPITKWMLLRFIKKNSIILGGESVST